MAIEQVVTCEHCGEQTAFDNVSEIQRCDRCHVPIPSDADPLIYGTGREGEALAIRTLCKGCENSLAEWSKNGG